MVTTTIHVRPSTSTQKRHTSNAVVRKASGKIKPWVNRRGKVQGRSQSKGKGKAFAKGPGRPRKNIYGRGGAMRKGYGRRGVRPKIGRPKNNSAKKPQRRVGRGGRGRRGRGSGAVLFKTRRNMQKNGRRGRPRNSTSKNNSSRSANTSDNYNNPDEEGAEKTTSLWRTYTCVVM